MKFIEYDGYKLYIEKSKYMVNNNLSLYLWTEDDGPYVSLTVNLPNYKLMENEVILDTNNFPDSVKIMEEYKLGKWTNNMAYSGFCVYPIYVMDMEEVEKYCVH